MSEPKPFSEEEIVNMRKPHSGCVTNPGNCPNCFDCRYLTTIAADRKRIEELGKYNEVLKGLRAEEAEDYEAPQSRLERMEKETISKTLLLKYLNQRIRYYEENKFPDHSRAYNDAIVNAYEWLKKLLEEDKLESATDDSAGQALKEKP